MAPMFVGWLAVEVAAVVPAEKSGFKTSAQWAMVTLMIPQHSRQLSIAS